MANDYGKDAVSKLTQAVGENKKLTLIVAVLAFLVILLTVGFFRLSGNVGVKVELPPKILSPKQDAVLRVGISEANDDYYEIWGSWSAYFLGNFDHRNFEKRTAYLAGYLRPDIYEKKKKELQKLNDVVKKNRLSQTFDVDLNNIVIKDGVTTVNGRATTKVGRYTLQKDHPCSYKIGMSVVNSTLYIYEYSNTCLPQEVPSKDELRNKR